jgi:hypothetical protein
MKYILLDRKVNHRIDKLILALIGNLKIGWQFGGFIPLEHYNDAHFLSISGKYLKRGRKEPHKKIAESNMVESTL